MTDDEPVGSLAAEAAKLFGVLGDWARDQGTDLGAGVADVAGRAAETARQVDQHLDDEVDTGVAECRWCPVCRTVHVVRNTSPEVREQLSVAATALLQAGSGILASFAASARPPARRAGEEVGGVERIDLDADPEAPTDLWED